MKFIDLFGGIGGFRLGIQAVTDWKCVWYNDFNKYSSSVYNLRFGEHYEPRDIREVDEQEIPEHDIICAGFPCQSFSIAGKRKGFEDIRGTLFYEICRIAGFHRSKWLFLENVKGILNHNEGKTFGTILDTLQELGYAVEWQVLNSKNHGVPQNRERVFIVGHLGELPKQQVFPISKINAKDNGDEGEIKHFVNSSREIKRIYNPAGLSPTLHDKSGGWQEPKIIDVSNARRDDGKRGLRVFEGICPTITSRDYKEPRCVIPCLTPDRVKKRQNGRRFKEGGEEMFTLTGQDIHGVVELLKLDTPYSMGGSKPNRSCIGANRVPEVGNEHMSIRRLTPLECERLQGFPDVWTAYGIKDGKLTRLSDTQRYKMLGNAVTVNVIESIARKMNEVFANVV